MKEMKWEDAKNVVKKGVTFLEFTTKWCGDCKMMAPVVDNVEKELEGKNIEFIQVDAEEANLFRDKDSEISVLKVPSFFKVVDNNYEHIGYEYLPLDLLVSKFK